jgi:multisubunit Na+/H+ antiporter MnhG subunit
MDRSTFLVNLSIAVSFFSFFLAVFFFTLQSHIEGQAVSKYNRKAVNSVFSDINNVLTDTEHIIIGNVMSEHLISPSFDAKDKAIEDNNRKLIINTMITMVSIIFLILTLSCIMCNCNIKSILLENISLLFFIGIVEGLFVMLIARNYKYDDPNVIKESVLNKIIDFTLQ